MQPILAPLNLGHSGHAVVNLHDGLRRLMTGQRIDFDDSEREKLLQLLARESQERMYGEATQTVVQRFQEQQGLSASGEVDRETASALNAAIEEIGGGSDGGGGQDLGPLLEVLQSQGETLESIRAEASRLATIEGRLSDLPDGETVRGMRQDLGKLGAIESHLGNLPDGDTVRKLGASVERALADATRSLALHARGDAVRALHAQLGHAGFALPADERREAIFGVATHDALLQLQERYGLARTGSFDDATRNALATAVGATENPARIEGRILLDSGQPAAGLRLRLVNRGFGGEETVVGELQTDERGFYALPYNHAEPLTGLALLAVKADGSTVALSRPKTNLERNAVVNLMAPAAVRAGPAEYGSLRAGLLPHIGQIERLATAREDAERRDLSALHGAIGWDARLIAVAAMAEGLHVGEGAALSQEGLYGLLRTGLPADRQLLAQVAPAVVEQALKTARDAGIVGLSDQQIDEFCTNFAQFAVDVRLAAPAPGSSSSYAQLLAASGLDEQTRNSFAGVFLEHGGDGAKLWDKAREAGLDTP